MENEISNIEEDFNIDELLGEDEDSPTEESKKEVVKSKQKKAVVKAAVKEEVAPAVPVEVANAERDLLDMEWQMISQQAYEGYQNIKTGEVIDNKEAIRRCLCYAQEAARNSR